jgi:carbamoyl-phosphate synthase large subunit
MAHEKLPILITAIGGGGHGEQILKAIRLSEPGRYFIVGADANALCPQFALVDAHATLPFANDPSYMERMLALCRKFSVKALFHGCEPELKLFAQYRDAIQADGIFLPINPTDVIQTCLDKEETNAALSKMGFSAPMFLRARSRQDLAQIDWFPVVVKPATGGGGSANVYIAQTRKELMGLADFLGLEEADSPFFVQEYVGTPESEYTVGVLHDMNGNYINSIGVRRLLSGQLNIRYSATNRSTRKDLGARLVISSGVSHGEVGRFPEVTSQCANIAKQLGATGAINIQCRLVDGQIRVFEINPRFSGTTSIRAMVGYNEPDVLIRKHLFGETIKQDFHYQEATILRRLEEQRLG